MTLNLTFFVPKIWPTLRFFSSPSFYDDSLSHHKIQGLEWKTNKIQDWNVKSQLTRNENKKKTLKTKISKSTAHENKRKKSVSYFLNLVFLFLIYFNQ
jgi:hypothetical protein